MEKQNISNLLSRYNLVVPEIQREYVWGANKNKRVLKQFLEDLNLKLGKGDANIGFLYSYVSGTENYLIDGQQRYTTILLLLHFLSVNQDNKTHKSFQEILRLDSNIAAFSYRVRSYTESFLNNLFISNATNSKDIQDQIWFKNDYLYDTTIMSMLGTLDSIKEIIDTTPNLTYDNILNKLNFWYFDVDKTSQGEELYITMNSRGEKLTDSEQMKPRLLSKETIKKQYYGKKWDEWEEFFYKKEIRSNHSISQIDIAMNNIIRVVLELETRKEHDKLNPIEDANSITLEKVELYMNALMAIADAYGGKYIFEIVRLYGDSDSDKNFYALKALLTEKLKNQDLEYERVYQTMLNHVRRNKIKNIPLLAFLYEYKNSEKSWYEFIIQNKENNPTHDVFNGHELEKIIICAHYGEMAERAIWETQGQDFWNGEIKQLLTWTSNFGIVEFSTEEFLRITKIFNLLFDQTENAGWTSDKVRQALLTRKMPFYPLDNTYFGYKSSEWKKIFHNNQGEILHFINEFDGKDAISRDKLIEEKIRNYPATPENKWAEFVQEPSMLAYLDTKHLYWDENYGFLLVQHQWARPFSVKNEHLFNTITAKCNYLNNGTWTIERWYNWNSCIVVTNSKRNFVLDIRYIRENANAKYNITLFRRDSSETKAVLIQIAEEFGFIFDESIDRYSLDVEFDDMKVVNLLNKLFNYSK